MKSGKWLFGGIGLQLGVGYTVAYGVYTIGTLLAAPETLHAGAAIGGFIAVLCMATVIGSLIVRTNRKLEKERLAKKRKINNMGVQA